jgi:hypothetical protein
MTHFACRHRILVNCAIFPDLLAQVVAQMPLSPVAQPSVGFLFGFVLPSW